MLFFVCDLFDVIVCEVDDDVICVCVDEFIEMFEFDCVFGGDGDVVVVVLYGMWRFVYVLKSVFDLCVLLGRWMDVMMLGLEVAFATFFDDANASGSGSGSANASGSLLLI